MYRVQWRRPGCLSVLAYLLLSTISAFAVAGVVAGMGEGQLGHWWVPLVGVAVFLALLKIHKLITRQQVPICPHCGVATNPQFPVCRACGREKQPAGRPPV